MLGNDEDKKNRLNYNQSINRFDDDDNVHESVNIDKNFSLMSFQ